MSAVELDGVDKRYGRVKAVAGVDLNVESGEFVTLLGPSGCGKTTTLQMIAGFVIPTAGKVRIGGRDCTRLAPHRRNVGMVFQNYALFPHMSLHDNIAFGLRMRGVPRAERDRRVLEALELVRLSEFGSRYPGQISGGQQQRVALARALVIRPDVLLLDEPFGALDKHLRDRMRVDLRELQKQLGISMVFVTHDQEEALSMSDRIAVMEGGSIRQIGSPSDIYERPANRFVAEFMGESNILLARIGATSEQCAEADASGVPLRVEGRHTPGAQVTLMIRPEKIAIGPAGSGGEGAIAGRVAALQYFGSSVHYLIALEGGQQLTAIRPESDPARRLAVGDTVAVDIPAGVPFVIDN